MRQEVTHFQLSAAMRTMLPNNLRSAFMTISLVFPLAGLLFIAVKVLNFIFWMGSWKQSPFCIRRCSNSLHILLSHALPTSQWIHQETQLSQWKSSRGRKDRFQKGVHVQLFSKRSTIEATSDSSLFMRVFSRSVCFVITLP